MSFVDSTSLTLEGVRLLSASRWKCPPPLARLARHHAKAFLSLFSRSAHVRGMLWRLAGAVVAVAVAAGLYPSSPEAELTLS